MKKFMMTLFLVSGFFQWTLAQTPEEAVNFLENEDGFGVKAQGMGNAFTAVADDYTAVYWNPAGLTQLDYHEISGSLASVRFKNEAAFHNSITLDNRSWTDFSHLGLAYKFPTTQGSFVVAFGYNRFKNYYDFLSFGGYNPLSNGLEFELENDQGESSYYPFDQNVHQSEVVSQDGNMNSWAIGGGIQFSPNFSLGLTLNLLSGKNEYIFDFMQEDVDNLYNLFPADYNRYELHQQINSEFTGWNVKAGGLLNITRDLNLGFTVEFPTSLHVTEIYSSNDILVFDDGYTSEYDLGSGEWEYLIIYPYKFSAGAALDLKMIMVAASADYRDWSQVRFDVPDGYSLDDDYNDLLNDNPLFAEQFRSVLSYAAGGEIRVPGSPFKLRAGYRCVPSPLREADPELDRIYYSFGLGYDIDSFTTLDVSYTQSKFKRTSVDSYTTGGTDESIETYRILAGIVFRL